MRSHLVNQAAPVDNQASPVANQTALNVAAQPQQV
jgi:hypothetical protein